jgi:hypothetical protein
VRSDLDLAGGLAAFGPAIENISICVDDAGTNDEVHEDVVDVVEAAEVRSRNQSAGHVGTFSAAVRSRPGWSLEVASR